MSKEEKAKNLRRVEDTCGSCQRVGYFIKKNQNGTEYRQTCSACHGKGYTERYI